MQGSLTISPLSLTENRKLWPLPFLLIPIKGESHGMGVYPPNIYPFEDVITHNVSPLLSHVKWKTLDLKPSLVALYKRSILFSNGINF